MAKPAEAVELGSPLTSRAASVSSERTSITGFAAQPIPSSMKPAPAYVAAAAASQIVTDLYEADQNIDRAGDLLVHMSQGALFSDEALVLVNSFLDYILYCILGSAKGTSLDTIRNAIFDVLKQKLARDATADADYELANLMGDDEDESADEAELAAGSWDLERIWRRTRLRIMVYTRLGEMDDDEELEYLDYDEDATDLGLIPPAAAIYLTSVMESVAEKIIRSAGQAALMRMVRESKKDESNRRRVIVEERDAEKIALDSTLGRLWRIWKRNAKAAFSRQLETPNGTRSSSAARLGNGYHAKHGSIDTLNGSVISSQEYRGTYIPDVVEIPDDEVSETDIAANIPLPMSEDDVAEIEGEYVIMELSGVSFVGADSESRRFSVSWPIFKSADADAAPLRRSRSFSDDTKLDEALEFAQNYVTEAHLADCLRYWKSERILETSPLGISTHVSDEDTLTGPRASAEGAREHEDGPVTGTASSFIDETDDAQVLNITRMSMGVPPSPPEVVRTVISGSPRTERGASHAVEESGEESNDDFATPFEPATPSGPAFGDDVHDPRAANLPETIIGKTDHISSRENPEKEGDREADEALATQDIGVARTSDVPISPADVNLLKQAAQARAVNRIPQHHALERSIAEESEPATMGQSSASSNLTLVPKDATAASLTEQEIAATGIDRHAKSPYAAHVTGQPGILQPDAQVAGSTSQPNMIGDMEAREAPERTDKPRLPPKDSTPGHDRSSSKPSIHTTNEQRPPSSGYIMLRRSGSTAHSSNFDTSPVQYSRGFDPKESAVVRERKFDDLIRNEETVKYTLTPQNMRDLDITPPPQATTPTKSRKLSFGGSTHSDRGNKVAPISTNGNKSGNSQLSSPTSVNSDVPSLKTSVPRSQIMNSKRTKTGLMAREPQARHESIFDLADYLRTTSPPRDNDPVVPRAFQGKYSPKTATASQAQGVTVPSAQPKLRLQPRSAVFAPSMTNELVSLIREGPPSNSRQSDGLDSVTSIPGSTQSGGGPSNSRTNLLPSRDVTQQVNNAKPRVQAQTALGGGPDRPAVTRTQRRVRDPYAISDDEDEEEDDEDDILTALPKKAKRREESLADFLKQVEPPASNGPTLLAASSTTTPKAGTGQNSSLQGSPNIGTSQTASQQGPMLKSKITIVPNRAKPVARPAGGANDKTIRLESYRGNLDIADFLRTTGPDDAASAAPARLMVGAGKEIKDKKGMRFWKKN